jgi:predicted dehydrogenase
VADPWRRTTVGAVSVRVGFLGAGFIARYHAMQLQLAEEPAHIAAVHDIDAERARRFVDEEGGGSVVDTIDELAAVCDAVFVCTWTSAHLDAATRLASAGMPIFCEKPLARDLSEARRLVEAVEQSAAPNMVGLVLRSSPALLTLRELVNDPACGRVMNVVFRDDQFMPTQGMYDSTWRGDVCLAGSGVLLEHSIHDVDLLEWIFGEVDWVVARESSFHGLAGIEDSVSALLAFRSGATGSLVTVWHEVRSRPSQRRIEVFCENALVTLEGDLFGPVWREDANGRLELLDDGMVDWLAGRGVPLVSAEQQFLVAVREHLGGHEPGRLDPDVRHALRAHVLVDAVYRSSRSGGTPVTVPPPEPNPRLPSFGSR